MQILDVQKYAPINSRNTVVNKVPALLEKDNFLNILINFSSDEYSEEKQIFLQGRHTMAKRHIKYIQHH